MLQEVLGVEDFSFRKKNKSMCAYHRLFDKDGRHDSVCKVKTKQPNQNAWKLPFVKYKNCG